MHSVANVASPFSKIMHSLDFITINIAESLLLFPLLMRHTLPAAVEHVFDVLYNRFAASRRQAANINDQQAGEEDGLSAE